jgi:predicted TIM-barrel fold metal-dependent hydrolase
MRNRVTMIRAAAAPVLTPPRRPSRTRAMRNDAHAHVWPSMTSYAYAPEHIPPCVGDVDSILRVMDDVGVARTLLVQPINMAFDHAYVREAIRSHPTRFVGCALANPSAGSAGVEALRALLERDGFRAARFNPALWPRGHAMDDDIGREMYSLCGELGCVVGFMCFNGLRARRDGDPRTSVEAIRNLLEAYPKTKVLIDHFGFCKGVEDESFGDLLALSAFENVMVKCSAHFRVQTSETSTREQLEALLDAFGANRLLWGSDYPFVTMQDGGYERAFGIIPSQRASARALATDAAYDAVLGGSFDVLFPK